MNMFEQISVIICTYNRARRLERCLQSISDMDFREIENWELIIIDNNSRDETRKVCEEFIQNHPGQPEKVRYILEERQGLSSARNRGVKEARGEIIAFIDDDVRVERNWLINIVREFRDEKLACIGGKILPDWEIKRPAWLKKELFIYLGLLDLGEEKLILKEPKIWGANFSLRASYFKKIGLFNTDIGRLPGKLYAGEETEFIQKIIRREEKVCYCPDIIVYHYVPVERLKKKYFRKWRFDQGELSGIRMGDYPFRNIGGVPLFSFKEIVLRTWNYVLALITGIRDPFFEQLKLFNCLGFIYGRMNVKKFKF